MQALEVSLIVFNLCAAAPAPAPAPAQATTAFWGTCWAGFIVTWQGQLLLSQRGDASWRQAASCAETHTRTRTRAHAHTHHMCARTDIL